MKSDLIFKEILSEMDDFFYSNTFANSLREKGHGNLVKNQDVFLHQNCEQGKTKRSWSKIKNNQNKNIKPNKKPKQYKDISSKKFRLFWGLIEWSWYINK